MPEAEDKTPLIESLNVQPGGKALVVGSLHGDINLHIKTPLTAEQSVRLSLLRRVKEDWIEGVLNQSLYKSARIDLSLEARSHVISYRPQVAIQVPDWEPVAIQPGAGIAEIFDTFGRALLISGASGVGKTTLLLELGNILIDRALQDERHPIPVVLHLSTWAVKRKPLSSWMVSELKRLGVRDEALAQRWIDAGELLPLLDGLDEVAANYRTDCLNAIHEFRDRWGLCPIALCSRTADLALGQQLNLRGAVIVHPLTAPQIDEQLSRNPGLLSLLHAKNENSSLAKLLETPLMLWVASLANRDKAIAIVKDETIEQTQQRLFSTFVQTQLHRGAINPRFTPNDTLHWLSWLAVTLENNKRKIFYLEDLSPEWLETRSTRWSVRLVTTFLFTLACGLVLGPAGGFMGSLLAMIEHGWHYALRFGWSDGLWTGFLVGLFFGFVSSFTDLRPAEAFSLRFAKDRARIRRAIRSTALFGLASSLLFVAIAILVGLAATFFGQPRSEIRGMALVALTLGLLVGLIVGAANLFTAETIERRRRPNQGTYSSIKRAFSTFAVITPISVAVGSFIGTFIFAIAWKILPTIHDPIAFGLNGAQMVVMVGGLKGMLLLGLKAGALDGLRFGIVLGLFGAMIYGGAFAIRHFVTRISAWLHRESPLAYASFLDFAVDRLFLLKLTEGGGYLFAHDTLAKYFISINQEQKD
jgi:eukaryotic-like serine/threonine-protein kinase